MEIERKYLVRSIPNNLNKYTAHKILQGYISTKPVIRIRQTDDTYYLTCKSEGLMVREEFEIQISQDEFKTLMNKTEYNMIEKTRYKIPIENEHFIELDIFHGILEGLIIAEVEFPTVNNALEFQTPSWFSEEVTDNPAYQNSNLCKQTQYPL